MRKKPAPTANPIERVRRSIRLKGYDYSRAGTYFVTICAQDQECLFGDILHGEIVLSEAGRTIAGEWTDLPGRFPFVDLDEFVVMPNHFHGIVILEGDHKDTGDHKDRPYSCAEDNRRGKSDEDGCRGEPRVRPPHRLRGTEDLSLGRIIQAFKSITTHDYATGVRNRGWPPFADRLWQRNYYEHVLRNEQELNRVRQYIADNPLKWDLDAENPEAQTVDDAKPWENCNSNKSDFS